MKSQGLWICLVLGSLSSLSGCVVSADHGGGGGYVGDALLTVDWTVDGSTSLGACDDFDVDYAHVSIDSSLHSESVNVPCADATHVDFPDIPEGVYDITIQLFDANDRKLTTAATPTIDVRSDDTNDVSVDFPADSFK